jgi:hypothetical protein
LDHLSVETPGPCWAGLASSPLFTLILIILILIILILILILISPRPPLGLAGLAPYRGIDIAARTMACV